MVEGARHGSRQRRVLAVAAKRKEHDVLVVRPQRRALLLEVHEVARRRDMWGDPDAGDRGVRDVPRAIDRGGPRVLTAVLLEIGGWPDRGTVVDGEVLAIAAARTA